MKTSRDLFVASFYAYEFLTVRAFWSLLAVEAPLRTKLDAAESRPFKALINEAVARGWLDEEQREVLHAGRELRNGFGHVVAQPAWSYGMAAPAIGTSHAIVAEPFPDAGEPALQEPGTSH